MTDPAAPTVADNWDGGFYELALELGDTDDDRLEHAVGALWSSARVHGRYAPDPMGMVPAPSGHLRGLVDLPNGVRMVCGAIAIREDEGADWLDFYLPVGALAGTHPRVRGFPFGEDGGPASLEWRRPIDDWLVRVATDVYAEVDFRLGLIGFEVSGDVYAKDLDGDLILPGHIGYVIPRGRGLSYRPATL